MRDIIYVLFLGTLFMASSHPAFLSLTCAFVFKPSGNLIDQTGPTAAQVRQLVNNPQFLSS